MGIKYEYAPDILEVVKDLRDTLGLFHIQLSNIAVIRSRGSAARGTVARCHALNKIMQMSLGRTGFYVLEFISEKFDKMSEEERVKVIIHEMLHIPKSFGGGFVHHDFVNHKNINKFFAQYKSLKKDKTIEYYG
jgi:predicted metallopeptidase